MFVEGLISDGTLQRAGDSGDAGSAGPDGSDGGTETAAEDAGFTHRTVDTGAAVLDLNRLKAEFSGAG